MNIHAIHDLSNNRIINILKKSLSNIPEVNMRENYSPEFSNSSANLFYILEHGRYEEGKGCYYIILEDNEFIASAGWNEYTSETALLLTRLYVSPKHRSHYVMGKTVLPQMIESCWHYNKIWVTVNDYNKRLYNWLENNYNGHNAALGDRVPELYSKFKPLGIKSIYFADQYVAEFQK